MVKTDAWQVEAHLLGHVTIHVVFKADNSRLPMSGCTSRLIEHAVYQSNSADDL
jgi:hypothetical protein